MKPWRKIALLVVVFCLAAGGSGFAMPAHDDRPAAMPAGCDDMAEATSDSDAPVDAASHDCCATRGCPCVAAHGVAFFAVFAAASGVMPVERSAAHVTPPGYASPALARLTRPPIS